MNAALASLATPASDERIYRLTTFDQVLGRVRRLLGDAEEVAVVDLFPACLERLRDDLAATKARGVDVSLKEIKAAEGDRRAAKDLAAAFDRFCA